MAEAAAGPSRAGLRCPDSHGVMDVNRTSGDKEEDEEEESVKVLSEARHLEAITAPNTAAHSWRLKERVRAGCLGVLDGGGAEGRRWGAGHGGPCI